MCSLGIEPTTFCTANTMHYHWATGTYKHYKLYWIVFNNLICFVKNYGNSPTIFTVIVFIYRISLQKDIWKLKSHFLTMVPHCFRLLVKGNQILSEASRGEKSIVYKQTWWIRNLYSVWILISFMAGFDSSCAKKTKTINTETEFVQFLRILPSERKDTCRCDWGFGKETFLKILVTHAFQVWQEKQM